MAIQAFIRLWEILKIKGVPVKGNKTVVLQVVAAMEQGGVEQGTLDMAQYIREQGWVSMVASKGGSMVTKLQAAGVKHISLPLKNRNPFAILYNAYYLAKIVRQYKVDILHARSRGPAWAALIASKITKAPLITSFHGTHKIQNKLKWLYNNVMTKGVFTIANSRFIWEHIIHYYHLPVEKLRIAERGINPNFFNKENISIKEMNALRKKWGLNDDPVILMPGRLTPWKGQSVFIKALSEIQDIPWNALVVGGADKKKRYEKELKAEAKKYGLEKRIIFTGGQSPLTLYYAIANIVVSASIEPEAFGRIAIEAGAMGVPVIATAHGGSLETIKDKETGYLVPVNDSTAMAKILLELIQDHEKQTAIGAKASNWIRNNFTVDKMCKKEFGVYTEVLNV